jgi:hypothetical protein
MGSIGPMPYGVTKVARADSWGPRELRIVYGTQEQSFGTLEQASGCWVIYL